jgi:hypothetical protein
MNKRKQIEELVYNNDQRGIREKYGIAKQPFSIIAVPPDRYKQDWLIVAVGNKHIRAEVNGFRDMLVGWKVNPMPRNPVWYAQGGHDMECWLGFLYSERFQTHGLYSFTIRNPMSQDMINDFIRCICDDIDYQLANIRREALSRVEIALDCLDMVSTEQGGCTCRLCQME